MYEVVMWLGAHLYLRPFIIWTLMPRPLKHCSIYIFLLVAGHANKSEMQMEIGIKSDGTSTKTLVIPRNRVTFHYVVLRGKGNLR